MRGEVSVGPGPATVEEALQAGARYLATSGVETSRLDAELLLGEVLGGGKERLYLAFDRPLGEPEVRRFEEMLLRRGQREPLAYILGKREFWSLDFAVTPDVLVPRPETERLVEAALELLNHRPQDSTKRLLDLGTGSGAVAVTLAKEVNNLELWATDLSAGALEIAELNAMVHGVRQRIRFLQGDLFEPVQQLKGRFHLIVSNPPYVVESKMDRLPPEVSEWEPRLALCGGADGLDFYRRISRDASFYLSHEGFVALEIGAGMAEPVSRLFAAAGCYSAPRIYQDLAGRDRVVVAQLKSTSL